MPLGKERGQRSWWGGVCVHMCGKHGLDRLDGSALSTN